MSSSPFAACKYSSEVYITPSRKPTEHHCNADKKEQSFVSLSEQDLAPLCRNLFREPTEPARLYVAEISLKSLR